LTHEDLKQIDLLSEFNDADRGCLMEVAELRSIASGRRVFSQGSESDGMVFVLSGSVRIEDKASGTRSEVPKGACLGALSLVALGKREATVFAESDCELLILERDAYRRLANDYPRTACRLAEAVLQQTAGWLRPLLPKLSAGL
jgi:CRP-like cAMP-binding protein